MSDPNASPRPSPEEEVDELPGESAPSAAASQLSLEEQIARLSALEDLEMEEGPQDKKS